MIVKKSTLRSMADYQENDKITENGDWDESIDNFLPDKTFEVLVNEQFSIGRWKSEHNLVFRDINTQKSYHITYEKGLTESQMESPFEYEPNLIECDEVQVKPKIITIHTWEW